MNEQESRAAESEPTGYPIIDIRGGREVEVGWRWHGGRTIYYRSKEDVDAADRLRAKLTTIEAAGVSSEAMAEVALNAARYVWLRDDARTTDWTHLRDDAERADQTDAYIDKRMTETKGASNA